MSSITAQPQSGRDDSAPPPPPPMGRICDSCGAPLDEHDKFCTACGTTQPAAAAPTAPAAAKRYLRCKNCGAEIGMVPDQRSYVCPFCDSTYVEDFLPDQTGRQEPEFVIGFAVTPAQALEKFRAWLNEGGWYRPGDLSTAEIEEKLKGVYLPFWSFSMLAESGWTAAIGEHWYRTETYTTTEDGKTVTHTRQVQETEWWNLAGRHHNFYSGFLVSGSRGLSQPDSQRIQPFQLPALKRYEPYYLAGWLSEEYSLSREQALAQCQQEFYRREQESVDGFMPGDTHSSLEVHTRFSSVNSDLILLPIYLLTYRYHDKLYRFLLNGQTGRVAGAKPVSPGRISLAVIGAIVLVLLLILLFKLFAG